MLEREKHLLGLVGDACCLTMTTHDDLQDALRHLRDVSMELVASIESLTAHINDLEEISLPQPRKDERTKTHMNQPRHESPNPGVPVAAAAEIARQYQKRIVVILSADADRVYITTYGVVAEEKIFAAKAGDIVAAAVGCDLKQKATYEDFRYLDSAKAKEVIDRLRELLAQCRDLIRDYTPTPDQNLMGQVDEALKLTF